MSSYSAIAVPITPVVYSSDVKYITSFRYAVADFDLNDQITLRILLLDQNGQPLEVKNVELNGCDYANWGNDDTYLVKYISSKLGFGPSIVQFSRTAICPFHTTDSANNSYSLVKVQYDSSGNLLLPTSYSRDPSTNMVLDAEGTTVSFQLLSYNVEGTAIPYGSISLDTNQNPVLPFGGSIDAQGYARNSNGEHLIMVSTL